MIVLIALALAVSGSDRGYPFGAIKETVALIELNHHYDTAGKPVFDQVILWDIDPTNGRFVVKAWLMSDLADKSPVKGIDGLYHVRWNDIGSYRDIKSRRYRESWTQVDPERADQRSWPVEERSGLIPAKPPAADKTDSN